MIKYLVRDMVAVLRFLPYGLVVGIVVAIILSAINDRRVKKQREPFSVLAFTSFFMYVAIMLFITFLSRESGSRAGVDLELFSTWGINDRNNAYVIENILLFIPYGFVCAWAIKPMRNMLLCTGWGVISCLGIECMQLFTGRGFFQIDDILTNTLGTIIGYIIFRCILNEERTGREKTRWRAVILSLLIMLSMMLGIIAFSSDSAEESNQLSMRVAHSVVNVIDNWLGIGLNNIEVGVVLMFVHPLLRKLAHASEYAALAVIIGFGYQLMKGKRAKVVNYFYAVMTCGMVAIIDEMLQKFVFGRSGRLMDIAIDVMGAIVGGGLYVFLSELFAFLSEDDT